MNISTDSKYQKWYTVIMECRSSGLTDRQYCIENGIKSPTFYYWVNKLRNLAFDIPEHESSQIQATMQEVVKVEFPIKEENRLTDPSRHTVTPSNPDPATAIVMNVGSIRLEIMNGASKETLRDTLLLIRDLC